MDTVNFVSEQRDAVHGELIAATGQVEESGSPCQSDWGAGERIRGAIAQEELLVVDNGGRTSRGLAVRELIGCYDYIQA